MSDRRDLRHLRRARHLAKRQQRQLATLELAGLTAVTLHTHDQQLTIAIERLTGAPLVDVLREALRERRQACAAEARQVRRDWLEGEKLDGRLAPPAPPPLP
ncbi:hypothetical protein [Hymenobacter psoromatis]|uniref:hypothetical protein n=1 Tax=Hymenobacter psoromatis TaxID=1484116 RepID=UPI001CC15605|nr:hypothetical protein [Hymenobacter psoromatis]